MLIEPELTRLRSKLDLATQVISKARGVSLRIVSFNARDKARILVVDDNEAGRYALTRVLKLAGHEVTEAGTARECYMALRDKPLDLVLLDVNLPDGNGIEICQHIKGDPKTALLPVIQTSACFTGKEDRVSGLESGADAYLTAPFDARELLAHVNALLRVRMAEERLRQALELNPQMPWTATPDGRVEDFSPRWLAMTGMTREKALRDGWIAVPHPEDHPRMLAAWKASVQTGQPYDVEHRIRTADGSFRWMHSRAYPHRGPDGSIIRWYGFTEDIQKRVDAESRTREAEERLRVALAAGGMGTWEWHVATGMVLTDACHRHLWEIEGTEELVPVEQIFSRIHPEDRGKAVSADGADAVKGRFDIDLRVVRRSGEVRWLRGSATPRRDSAGKVTHLVGVNFDITDQKRAEEALRESERRFRVMADGSPISIWVTDAEGSIRFVNRAYREFFSVTSEQVRASGWLPFVHAEDAPAYTEAFMRALRERATFHTQARVRRHDGAWRWVESYGQPLFTAAGDFIGMVGSSPDVTDRREFQSVLELEVKERTAKLHELVGELEHFSYSLVHDMRAPLRAMCGYAEVLRESAWAEQPEVKNYLDRIVSSAARMDLLIRDALSYNRAVREDLKLEPVDLHRLVHDMLESYPEFLAHRDRVRIEGTLPAVLGSEAALIQCFSNLIGNAVKFVAPGQMPDIRLSCENVRSPDNSPSGAAGRVRIWVEDRGIGISENMRPRIFDMFTRGSAKYEGTGIGLALVRKVVGRMGGSVGVEPRPGGGSRFWVELQEASKPVENTTVETTR